MNAAKFNVGDHVASQSGLAYIVLAIHALDECGSFAYSVRRLRGGQVYGPTRQIAECNLFNNMPISPNQDADFEYDPDGMFPFASKHMMTD